MVYNLKKWKERLASRSDLSSQLIHLTKDSIVKGKTISALSNLKNIISERTINGSNNNGYVVGKKSATCFQDAPLYAACQNTYFEQKNQKSASVKNIRYLPIGIMFPKEYIFEKDGRPVLYEKTLVAKKILPKEEWWRIVNFDMSNHNSIIDWTHEREWRVPGNFEFDIEQATLLFVKTSIYKSFIKWDEKQEEPIIGKIKSLVVLSDVFY